MANSSKITPETSTSSERKKKPSVLTLSDKSKKNIFEEIIGSLSASSLITIISLTAGGITALSNPIIGTIIIIISIIYGSFMKVISGKFYEKRILKKQISQTEIDRKIEEKISKLLVTHKVFKFNSTRYFIRKISPFSSPVSSPKSNSIKPYATNLQFDNKVNLDDKALMLKQKAILPPIEASVCCKVKQ
jgi:hypothetical protein